MASYATYRHVELDRIGHGKKRVNHPPGGVTRLNSQEPKEPQTVRVLKPPGGDSSIFFSDDDRPTQTTKTEAVSTSPDNTECSASPELTITASTEEATNGSHQDSEKSPLVDQLVEANESKHGTDETMNMPPLTPDVSADNYSASTDVPIKSSDVTSSSSSLESSPEKGSHDLISITDITSGQSREEVNSLSICSAVADEMTSHSKERELQVSVSTLTIESPSSSLPTSDPSVNIKCSQSTSSSATPSVKAYEDTTHRLFGQPSVLSPPGAEQQTRKTKDHMRSSIFESDEGYTPRRSSRLNESVVSIDVKGQPISGQRGRVPPGGFSTKLW